MPRIKFIRDVPNEGGEGLLYAEGYEADVAYATAQKWIRSGDAVDPNTPQPVIAEDEDETASEAEEDAEEGASNPPRSARRRLGLHNAVLTEADLSTKTSDESEPD